MAEVKDPRLRELQEYFLAGGIAGKRSRERLARQQGTPFVKQEVNKLTPDPDALKESPLEAIGGFMDLRVQQERRRRH